MLRNEKSEKGQILKNSLQKDDSLVFVIKKTMNLVADDKRLHGGGR